MAAPAIAEWRAVWISGRAWSPVLPASTPVRSPAQRPRLAPKRMRRSFAMTSTRCSVIAGEKLFLLCHQHGPQHPSSRSGGEALALLREQRASHYGTVKLIWFDGPLSTPLASTLFISYS